MGFFRKVHNKGFLLLKFIPGIPQVTIKWFLLDISPGMRSELLLIRFFARISSDFFSDFSLNLFCLKFPKEYLKELFSGIPRDTLVLPLSVH